MLAFLLIQYLHLNNRARRLVGISVVFVLVFFGGLIYLNLDYFDRLNRYADKNSYFYFHLNRERDNFYQLKIINNLLANYRLDDFNQHWLGKELAFICQSRQDDCALILTTKAPQQLSAYLAAKRIPYKQLASGDFAIASNATYLQKIKNHHNPILRQRYQSVLGKNSQLTLVISQPQTESNAAKLLNLAGVQRLKLFGHSDNQGLYLTASTLPTAGVETAAAAPDCDIFLRFSGNNFNQLKKSFAIKYPALADLQLKDDLPLSFCAKKISAQGDFFQSFAFTLDIQTPADEQLQSQINELITQLSPLIQPTEKTFYLGGKDKITLLYPGVFTPSADLTDADQPLKTTTTANNIIIYNKTAATTTADNLQAFINTDMLDWRPVNLLLLGFSNLKLQNSIITIH